MCGAKAMITSRLNKYTNEEKEVKIYKTLPDGTTIVEYEDSLAPAVAEMWNRSGEGWGGTFGDGVWTADLVISKRASGAFFNVYVAMKDGEALGYCSFDRYIKDEDTAYVHLLNVRPDYHGKKIGKELVLMCVDETIARGMPRLDINTWPGNTKSVPLYKKCGFLWEDRSDTTHLINYIPTVLSTELLKSFFEKASWYDDSSRKIDLNPDGVKKDKFEFFEYQWEKDGQNLRVGFEKSGRRIRLIETDDYKIEMTAENHELAFGLSYRCRFHVVNKTGANLNVAISAKSDGVVGFGGNWEEQVSGEAVYEGDFSVSPITEAQDPMRMHPCILADVRINGKHAEFGLGIEPKFPVEVNLAGPNRVAKPGVTEDSYINVKNNLPGDATVRFTLPENPLMLFKHTSFEIRLNKGKDLMLKTSALLTGCGYAALPVLYEVTLDSGATTGFSSPVHLVAQGAEDRFAFETEKCHGAANGLWRLRLNKQNNTVNFDRLIPSGHGEFPIPRLGKPYDDEFNIAAPDSVRVTETGAFIRFEADFVSAKFVGAVLTVIYEFDAAGTLRYSVRVTNKGQNPLDLSVKTDFWTNIAGRAVFHYDGDFHEVADDMNFGFASLDSDKIDENWIFDSRKENPSGVYWPAEYKPDTKWGDMLEFENETGTLTHGQSFETKPIVYMCNVFKNFREFRCYVLGIHDETVPHVRNHLEVEANGGNPILSAETLALAVRNNRLKTWGGEITVSSPEGLFESSTQKNPADELCIENTFPLAAVPGNAGISFADFTMQLSGFEKNVRRALFITDDSRIVSEEKDGILNVTNGDLQFSVAPGYSDAAYSLRLKGNEWFYSRYPSLEPYSWWNPFVGGLKTFLERMSNSLALREKITAAFVTETDNLGNVWTGIRADVTIEKFDEYKGMSYSQYYLTLPGVPVMCHFTRLENNAGRFLDAELYSMLFLSGKEGLTELSATLTTDDKAGYKLRFSGEGHEQNFDRLIAFSRDGDSRRAEKLYVYKDSARDRGKSIVEYDINIAFCDYTMKGYVPDGGKHATKPTLCILTEKELTLESLTDLSRIEFK